MSHSYTFMNVILLRRRWPLCECIWMNDKNVKGEIPDVWVYIYEWNECEGGDEWMYMHVNVHVYMAHTNKSYHTSGCVTWTRLAARTHVRTYHEHTHVRTYMHEGDTNASCLSQWRVTWMRHTARTHIRTNQSMHVCTYAHHLCRPYVSLTSGRYKWVMSDTRMSHMNASCCAYARTHIPTYARTHV